MMLLKKTLVRVTPLSTFITRRLPFIPSYTSFQSPASQPPPHIIPPPHIPLSHHHHHHHHHKPSLYCHVRLICSNNTKMCWHCHATQSSPFLLCPSCASIQPPHPSINFFHIFALEKKYDIEVGALEGQYKNWQKKLHPDLVHSKSEKERAFAAEQSAKVIDAYRTLTNPLSRAIYLLKLEGEDVDEEQTVSDPELLAEIMEIREAVEEASDSEALNHIISEMQGKLKHWSSVFANAFQSRNFEEAKTSIQRMTYYERVIDEAKKKL